MLGWHPICVGEAFNVVMSLCDIDSCCLFVVRKRSIGYDVRCSGAVNSPLWMSLGCGDFKLEVVPHGQND